MTKDHESLAEKAAAMERHLRRVADRLPDAPEKLTPLSDAADAVILHLWQAVQIVVDLAVSICVKMGLGAPQGYAEAFRRLAAAGMLSDELAERLARAAGFRNVVAHAYEGVDLRRVFDAAKYGPSDLRAFIAAIRDL